MVSISSTFAWITVWFQYRLKGFPHALKNMLGREKYPEKKKELKALITAASFQNTIFYLELKSNRKKNGGKKMSPKLIALSRFTFSSLSSSLTSHTAHLRSFTSSCVGFHQTVVCPLVNTNTAVQQLLICLFWISLGRKENTSNYWSSSSAGMVWNLPVSQSVERHETCARSCRDKLVHHLFKKTLRKKDGLIWKSLVSTAVSSHLPALNFRIIHLHCIDKIFSLKMCVEKCCQWTQDIQCWMRVRVYLLDGRSHEDFFLRS